jgi:hypothetical protein
MNGRVERTYCSFYRKLSSTFSALRTVLGAGDTRVKKTEILSTAFKGSEELENWYFVSINKDILSLLLFSRMTFSALNSVVFSPCSGY